jgi:hypothetical protein
MTGPAAPENGLQFFGDWVLAALEQHADGAVEAARLMIAALQERGWEGDDQGRCRTNRGSRLGCVPCAHSASTRI